MADRIADLQKLKRRDQYRFLLYLHWLRFIDQPRLIPLKATVAVGIFIPFLLLVK
jgi:hypothetical protein